jgi:hypothetical protein
MSLWRFRISKNDDDDDGICLYIARGAGELGSAATTLGWLGVMTLPFCIITRDLDDIRTRNLTLISLFPSSIPSFRSSFTLRLTPLPLRFEPLHASSHLIQFAENHCLSSIGIQLFQSEHSNG